jgi:hypothetical protein
MTKQIKLSYPGGSNPYAKFNKLFIFNPFNISNTNLPLRDTNYRCYASNRKKLKDYSLISNTLRKLESSFAAPLNGFRSNEDTQRFIETFVYNEFDNNVKEKTNYVANIDTSILGATVSNYVSGKLKTLNNYIDSLFEVAEHDFLLLR